MKFYAYTPNYHNETSMAMHLCWQSPAGLEKLNRGFGILYPKADMAEGGMAGRSKGLVQPWVTAAGQGFLVAALRRNPLKGGASGVEEGLSHCVLLFKTRDLMAYEELGLRAVAAPGEVIEDVRCLWQEGAYLVWIQVDGTWRSLCSVDLVQFSPCTCAQPVPARQPISLHDAMPACAFEVPEAVGQALVNRLMPLKHTGYLPPALGEDGQPQPTVTLTYQDGSTFVMPAAWRCDALQGSWVGKPQQEVFPFPLMPCRGDPMAIRWKGGYLYAATDDERDQRTLKLRWAPTLAEIPAAQDQVIFQGTEEGRFSGCLWAPELHWVSGKLCLFFAAGKPHWYTVQSHVMVLEGDDPLKAECWSAPQRVCKMDGSNLIEEGITLDMTLVDAADGYYVIWAQRDVRIEPFECGTSDLYIARLSPEDPSRLSSEPKCLCRAEYGWERIGTTVVEGPFCLKREGKLFITYAAALIDHTYCVGLLSAGDGDDLMNLANWTKSNFPILHRRSMPDQLGAGHNSFVKDDLGRDVLLLHALSMENYLNDPADGRRYPCFRYIHWDAAGYPRLDVRPEEELMPGAPDVHLI